MHGAGFEPLRDWATSIALGTTGTPLLRVFMASSLSAEKEGREVVRLTGTPRFPGEADLALRQMVPTQRALFVQASAGSYPPGGDHVNRDARERIDSSLAEIERDEGVRILHACEGGSPHTCRRSSSA